MEADLGDFRDEKFHVLQCGHFAEEALDHSFDSLWKMGG
jgi:hypothetical protein